MGLDAVEIVMHVEDYFGIPIQNTEAERVRTEAGLARFHEWTINFPGPVDG